MRAGFNWSRPRAASYGRNRFGALCPSFNVTLISGDPVLKGSGRPRWRVCHFFSQAEPGPEKSDLRSMTRQREGLKAPTKMNVQLAQRNQRYQRPQRAGNHQRNSAGRARSLRVGGPGQLPGERQAVKRWHGVWKETGGLRKQPVIREPTALKQTAARILSGLKPTADLRMGPWLCTLCHHARKFRTSGQTMVQVTLCASI